MSNDVNYKSTKIIPVVPLRGLVVFPGMVLHFDVGRKKTAAALNKAMQSNQKVFLVCQRDASVDDPVIGDLFEIGVVCSIKQMIKIPRSENLRVVVEGLERGLLLGFAGDNPYLSGEISFIDNDEYKEFDQCKNGEERAYARAVRKEFERYASLMPKISSDVIAKVISITSNGELADYICSNTFFDYVEKQNILSAINPFDRLVRLLVELKKENKTLEIEEEIQEKVKEEIDKNQREYYLREEMKVISETLGESESPLEEADNYRMLIDKLDCSSEIKEKLFKECDRLMKMPSGSHEGTVIRGYLDRCLEIPFGKYTKNTVNLSKARKILDRDHYGLDSVKDRVIDSLAVYKRNPDFNGQIICLAGPPGIGKTSIVKSLAESMNRKYVRIALGGIHDEAEIRGHRKTYIGAMTGRIIDALIRSKVMNPIILLDEIDKLSGDYKGDPAAALLEALDPEQNNSFNDNFIDFPVDLSKVMFITTANDTSAIPAPLYDRMEVIDLTTYTTPEKFNIAKKHLIKKELKKHGLSATEFKITDNALYDVIECYTKEAGVRGLQKQIAALCRKAIISIDSGSKTFRVNEKNLQSILGRKKYTKDEIDGASRVGVVNGLAWTSVGGTLLPIEVSMLEGSGKLELTGNLGDVMKESAKTAVSFVRSKCDVLGIDSDFYKTKDIHIHAPEGAIPKDGPSAGLAVTTALVSELTGIPIKSTVAMTGEISLKGKAMAIGGLKEKSMAAYKAGCTAVIIPADNEKDLEDISNEVKNAVKFICVTEFEEILPIALDGKSVNRKINKTNVVINGKTDNRRIITQ